MKRPAPITVICWIVLILSALGILGAFYIFFHVGRVINLQIQQGVSPALVYYNLAISAASPVINLILSILMLRGTNWSRYVYLIFNAILYIIALIITPHKLFVIAMLVIFCLFIYYLFNAKANRFFLKSTST